MLLLLLWPSGVAVLLLAPQRVHYAGVSTNAVRYTVHGTHHVELCTALSTEGFRVLVTTSFTTSTCVATRVTTSFTTSTCVATRVVAQVGAAIN